MVILSISPHKSAASFELRLDEGKDRRLAKDWAVSEGPENEPSFEEVLDIPEEEEPPFLLANMACSSCNCWISNCCICCSKSSRFLIR